MFAALRQAFARRIEFIAELVGLLISLSGATVAAVLGRLMLAAVLGAIVFGLFLRLSGRRKLRVTTDAHRQRQGGWRVVNAVRPTLLLLLAAGVVEYLLVEGRY